HFTDAAAPDVRAALEAAATQLERAGAVVDEVNLTQVTHVGPASAAIVASEALAYHAAWMRSRPQDYQADVRERLRMGAFVNGAQYVRAQQIRALVAREIDEALARRDVLLAPATPLAAPVLGERETTLGDGPSDVRAALLRCTRPFNLSGHPACAAPCGFTAGGLPVGLQIVGRPFDEATVLRVVDAYQRTTDWHTRRPTAA
ncbi:MAG: amidase family protein, partial [Candidatus Rokuibacteriota bacterium]